MRTLLLSVPAAWLFFLGTTLPAQDGVPDPKDLFQQLDRNKDGKLASDEIPKEQARYFERLVRNADKNGDGQLTLEEFTVGHKADDGPGLPLNNLGGQGGRGPGGGDLKQRFDMLDRNKDGKVSRNEVPEFARERLMPLFDRLGKDELTLDEFRQGFGGGGAGPRSPLFIRLLDADRNGRITKAEWAKAADLFSELDKNQDGELDISELMGPPPEGAERPPGEGNGGFGPQFFRQMDRNNDGKISLDEAGPRIKQRFQQLDRNGDGFITPEELRSAGPPPGGRPESSNGQPRSKRPAE
jgi:Ca2+-binding EF-hand superfamily protein